MDRTPTEDFFTESLVGVLNSNRELQNSLVEDVLEIPTEENFKLFTQKTFILNSEIIRVDIVLESKSWLCFLEMKVYSGEGYGQLEQYREFLTHPQIHQDKKIALRYCTLYLDPKEEFEEDDLFKQFRWKDIAIFLSEYIESNPLIDEFYQFLKEESMAGNERFNYQDLLAMKSYGELTSKVEEVFQLIKIDLESRFGDVSGGINAAKQSVTHGRIAIWCKDVIGDNGWSEVLVAFQFSGSKVTNSPQLVVQLWVSKSNSSFNDLRREIINKRNYKFVDDVKSNGGGIRFEKPLAEFIEYENQINDITSWITDRLENLHQLKEQTSKLNWYTDG